MTATAERQSDTAYKRLKQAILRGEMTPGQPLDVEATMRELGVGRTPLREALQRLAQESLVRDFPRRGYFVTEVSASDLFHLFEMRLGTEPMSARLAAARVTPEDLAAFDALIAEAEAGVAAGNEDIIWNLGLDEAFHRLLAQIARNPYLIATVVRHYALSVRALYLSPKPVGLVKDDIALLHAMRDALARHDGDRAEALMRHHLGTGPLAMGSPVGPPSIDIAALRATRLASVG